MDMEEELEKLKYHISLLADQIPEMDTYAGLMIGLDWGPDVMGRVHDIFERHDKILEQTKSMDGGELERELRELKNVGYQEVKRIVRTLWANDQWMGVCLEYAKQFTCSEFHSILNQE